MKAKDRRAAERKKAQDKKGGNRQDKGTPGDNQRQNKQFKDATRGLSKEQKQKIHQEISKKGTSYQEIKQLAKEKKNE